MATTISKQSVQITGDTRQYKESMTRAQMITKKFGSSVTKMSGILKTAGVTAIAGLAVGFGALVKAQFETIDATAKLSTALGTTVGAIEGLKFAGNIAGVGADEVTKALSRMTRGIGQARQGLAAQKRAFESLGLSADKLATKDPSEALIDILAAMAELPDVADRAAVAADIFGREGLKLLPLAAEGADGIRALVEEGSNLSGLGQAGAKEIENMNDAFTRLKAAVVGVANVVSVLVAPWLEDLAKWLSNVIRLIQEFKVGLDINNRSLVGFGIQVITTYTLIRVLIIRVFQLAKAYMAAASAQAFLTALGGPAGIAVLVAGMAAATASVIMIKNQFNDMADAGRDAMDAMDDLGGSIDELNAKFDKFKSDTLAMLRALERLHALAELGDQTAINTLKAFDEAMASNGDVDQILLDYINKVDKTFEDRNEALDELMKQISVKANQAGMSQNEILLEQVKTLSGGKDTKEYIRAQMLLDTTEARNNLAKLREEVEKLNKSAADFGKSDIRVQLEALKDLGANWNELTQAAELLKKLAELELKRDRDIRSAQNMGKFGSALEAGTQTSLIQLQKNASENKAASIAEKQRREQIGLHKSTNELLRDINQKVPASSITESDYIDLGF